jgi:hypothetical protein
MVALHKSPGTARQGFIAAKMQHKSRRKSRGTTNVGRNELSW